MIDWTVQNGDLVVDAQGNYIPIDSIAQQVYITFSVWIRDWFYDLGFGIDYQNLKKGTTGTLTIDQVNLKIQSILLAIDGVVSITSFNSTFNQSTRYYEFTVIYTTTDQPDNVLNFNIGG